MNERVQRLCEAFQCARAIDVGAGLERILPFELEQDSDFF